MLELNDSFVSAGYETQNVEHILPVDYVWWTSQDEKDEEWANVLARCWLKDKTHSALHVALVPLRHLPL